MSYHIIFFVLRPLTSTRSLRRAELERSNYSISILHASINAGEFVASRSHTQHLIYSELLTILTVKIMVFMDFHKSLINESVSV